MSKKFNNKIVLISGASRGFGCALAKELGAGGAHVIGLARTSGALEELSDIITQDGGTSTMAPLDILSDKNLEKLGLLINDRWGKLDLLIHAACIATPMAPVTSLALKDFDLAFQTNARATQKMIQVFHPLLKKSQNAKAVFIDDQQAGKFLTGYAASKAACRIIISNYKRENERLGPKVLIFSPKPMSTALRAKFFPGEDKTKLHTCQSQAKKLIKKLQSLDNYKKLAD